MQAHGLIGDEFHPPLSPHYARHKSVGPLDLSVPGHDFEIGRAGDNGGAAEEPDIRDGRLLQCATARIFR